ncbi:PorP/SprF family type IX secretion system membrane protein [Pedobacter caeni]|uniref:Type IX secretion system membrane protein, PorP/SprF family n=1 Tax=Pedobacter caeni TaxID=288992 RepID=A0A1M5INS7_9SPHI|nr:PorP/SprF family type IX secretion system membrane protein [Pedobacter caeni]SHG29937.1 type IX secretion system membrane protein, PorP/SprF family [Pedobacter caeni]
MIRTILVTVFLMIRTLSANAQLNTLQAMYFQNPFLYNPAMAGMEKGVNVNIGYLQQWNSFPGTPKTSFLTAEMKSDKRVGLGLTVSLDEAGLIRSTKARGTYAYHLPLNNSDKQLNFGLSLGIDDSRIDYNNIRGDGTDESVVQYNQLKPYVDGDLGIAYTSNSLNIGAALPNLKSAFFKAATTRFDADRLLFIASISYKIPLYKGNTGFIVQPLTTYRLVKGHKDIVDVGLNFAMENYGLYMQGIYHSSDNMSVGLGLNRSSYAVSFAYNFETGAIRNYTGGGFELGIKLKVFDK